MRNPVIVVARDGDVWIFRTADGAAAWMEAQDVRDGEYRLYDCAGGQYDLVAETDSARVRVGPRLDGPDDFVLVRDIATEYLEQIAREHHRPADLGQLTTPDEICRALHPVAR